MNNLVQNKQSVNETWLVYAVLQKKKNYQNLWQKLWPENLSQAFAFAKN